MTDILVQTKSPNAANKLDLNLIGVVFHISWLFILLFCPPLDNEPRLPGTEISLFYLSAFSALVPVALLLIIAQKHLPGSLHTKHGVIAANIITLIGTALYCLALGIQNATELLIIAGIFAGAGSCASSALWAVAFARVSPRQICLTLPSILALALALCTDMCFVPLQAQQVALVIICLLNMACLMHAVKTPDKENVTPRPETKFASGEKIKSVIPPIIIAAALFILGILEGLLANADKTPFLFFDSLESFAYSLICVVVVAALGFFVRDADRDKFKLFFCAPILSIAIFLMPLLCQGIISPSEVVYILGAVGQELVVVTGVVALAVSFKIPPLKSFLVARISLGLSDILSRTFGISLTHGIMSESTDVVTIVLCELIIVLVIAISVLLHKYNRNQRSAPKTRVQEDTGSQIRQSREQLANKYGLSPRECDVFFLLAEGRSAPRICEELNIAESTVNTHTYNIYGKLGVHNRQEMLDLVHGETEELTHA